jgi:hypothetical protein
MLLMFLPILDVARPWRRPDHARDWLEVLAQHGRRSDAAWPRVVEMAQQLVTSGSERKFTAVWEKVIDMFGSFGCVNVMGVMKFFRALCYNGPEKSRLYVFFNLCVFLKEFVTTLHSVFFKPTSNLRNGSIIPSYVWKFSQHNNFHYKQPQF